MHYSRYGLRKSINNFPVSNERLRMHNCQSKLELKSVASIWETANFVHLYERHKVEQSDSFLLPISRLFVHVWTVYLLSSLLFPKLPVILTTY